MGQFNPEIHRRRTIRLSTYDYASEGAYFVTICAYERERLFGEIKEGKMDLSDIGQIVNDSWIDVINHHPHAALDEWVVMPNHFHAILWIQYPVGATPASPGSACMSDVPVGMPNGSACMSDVPVGMPNRSVGMPNMPADMSGRATQASPLPSGPRTGSIGAITGSFKSSVSRRIHEIDPLFGPVWQRNYYERIIRTDSELYAVRRYIKENPLKLTEDPENRS